MQGIQREEAAPAGENTLSALHEPYIAASRLKSLCVRYPGLAFCLQGANAADSQRLAATSVQQQSGLRLQGRPLGGLFRRLLAVPVEAVSADGDEGEDGSAEDEDDLGEDDSSDIDQQGEGKHRVWYLQVYLHWISECTKDRHTTMHCLHFHPSAPYIFTVCNIIPLLGWKLFSCRNKERLIWM